MANRTASARFAPRFLRRPQEIRSYEAPPRIANAPPFIKGVVNLRGVTMPFVDLGLRLCCDTAESTDLTVVIVLNVCGRVGVVVDSVSDVLALGREKIKAAPELNSTVENSYITGIGIGCVTPASRSAC